MTDDARQDELRGLLAEALHRRLCAPLTGGDQPCQSCRDDADALLPVVESYAAQKAAEELRNLADTYAFLGATLHNVPVAETYAEVAAELRARAAALSPGTEKEKRRG